MIWLSKEEYVVLDCKIVTVCALGVSGSEENWEISSRIPNSDHHFPAPYFWHHNIKKDQLDFIPMFLEHSKGFFTVRSQQHTVAVLFENSP